MFHFLSALFGNSESIRLAKRRPQKRASNLTYDTFEPRQMLHGGTLFGPGQDAIGAFDGGHVFTVTSIQNSTTKTSTANVTTGGNGTFVVTGKVTNSTGSFGPGHVTLQIKTKDSGGTSTTTQVTEKQTDSAGEEIDVVVQINFVLTVSNVSFGPNDFQYQVRRKSTDPFTDVTGLTTRVLVNQIPVTTSPITAIEDVTFTGTLATDPDGDSLTYSSLTQPDNGTVTITNASTGAYTYLTDENDDRNTSFTFRVNDTHTTVTKKVVINVTPVVDDPAVTFTDNVIANTGSDLPLDANVRAFTNDNTPVFEGDTDRGAKVTLTLTRTTTTGTTTIEFADQLGTEETHYVIPVSAAEQIPDGDYDLRVTTDTGGNSGPEPLLFTVDTAKPGRPSGFQLVNDAGANDADGVSKTVGNLAFTNSVDVGPSGISHYLLSHLDEAIIVDEKGQSAQRIDTANFDLSKFARAKETNAFRIFAVDRAGNLSDQADFTIEFDVVAPKIVNPNFESGTDEFNNPAFKSHEGADPKNIQLISDQIQDSVLPIPVITTERKPTFKISVQDQQFAGDNNQLNAKLEAAATAGDSEIVVDRDVAPGFVIFFNNNGTNSGHAVVSSNTDEETGGFRLVLADPIEVDGAIGDSLSVKDPQSASGDLKLESNANAGEMEIVVDQDVAPGLAIFIGSTGNGVGNVVVSSSTDEETGGYRLVLTAPLTSNLSVGDTISVEQEQFSSRDNQVFAQLFLRDGSTETAISEIQTRNITPFDAKFGPFQTSGIIDFNLTPTDDLPDPNQDYTVFVRISDLAGNVTNSDDLTFYLSDVGEPTINAPGTPVYTDLYYLGARLAADAIAGTEYIFVDQNIPVGFGVFLNGQGGNLGNIVKDSMEQSDGSYKLKLTSGLSTGASATDKVAWLRPWQMSFDKSTQTVWFTMEDGDRLGQFDPTTGRTTIYDVSLAGDEISSTDPHGAFFDFNSHLTPRVWLVYRNVSSGEPARVSYFDVEKTELFTLDLRGLATQTDPEEKPLEKSHATFVDARGDVWLLTEEGGAENDNGALVRLNFDRPAFGPDSTLDGPKGFATVYEIPKNFGGRDVSQVHGIQVVVDDRDGSQYVYFLDRNEKGGGDRSDSIVGLLNPADPDDSSSMDQWFSWSVPAPNDVTADSHLLFTAIDDNETPGIPEDDKVIFSNPGFIFRFKDGGLGLVYSLEVDNVIKAIQTGTAVPVSSNYNRITIPNLPDTNTKESAPNQTFIDRQGTIFAADPQGGVIRFNFDDASEVVRENDAIVTSVLTAPVFQQPITMERVDLPEPPLVLQMTLDQTIADSIASRPDRSGRNGVDQYVVAAEAERRGNGEGPFRGALNATNVLYGSIAQSDHISTTVFAETARRQMTVVKSPQTPTGALEGRMAFQVLRDGTLFMTGRADGQIRDIQQDISKLLNTSFKVTGDVSATVDANGNVHVVGKQVLDSEDGKARIGLLVFTYYGSWLNQADLYKASNWSVKQLLPLDAGHLLIGDPIVYLDEATGKVRALVTTNEGRLFLYKVDQPANAPTLLAPDSPHRVYASPGVIQRGTHTYVYGTNQRGELVEFDFLSNDPISATSRVVTYSRPDNQDARDVRVFQDVEAVLIDGKRHVYATDGNSRLVHIEIDHGGNNVSRAENVTKIVADSMSDNTKVEIDGVLKSVDTDSNDLAEGWFPFQEPYVGRVYSGLEVLVDQKGNQFVYGTNGGELILFIKRPGQEWRAANLTNDIYSFHGNLDGPDRGGAGEAPARRVPANGVFGSPGGYIEANGDRHLFQINAEGEVVEYYILANEPIPRFHTQNINFRINGS